MKKETLLEIILGTIGGLVLAIGMTFCLVAEWNLLKVGVIVGIIGLIILLAIIPIHKKHHPKEHKKIDASLIITWVIGIIGALIMGFGMSKVLIDNPSQTSMIIGIIVGIIGLIICVLNYPIYSYLKNKD